MSTAYIYFGKPVNPETIGGLVHACRSLWTPGCPVKRFHIDIASGGGDVIAAFGAHNMLATFPVSLSTHNAGAVDSSAILLFLAGDKRTASPLSAFFFHQLQWSFGSSGPLTKTEVTDAGKWLTTYEDLMAKRVADRSNLAKEDVVRLMREGSTVRAEEALEMGLVSEITDLKHNDAGPTWVV